jgi:single-stranded-DNA-specific exonuclease
MEQSQEKVVVTTPEQTELPAVVRDILRGRGMVEAAEIEQFLHPNYEHDLADPFLMTDMNNAVDRIVQAVQKNETVAVYGDYDIDGVVSTALMIEVLEMHGLKPKRYIPDRFEEGYGINTSALTSLKADGVDLVISVDCGITSVKEVEWAKENGLDIIITDHHEVPAEIPQAVAVVNPKRAGDKYPFKELAGVGVAFAVARALQQRTGIPEAGREKWLLDLVALGTVCDVMPLVSENRTLVKFGLLVLRKSRRVGLVALAQAAGMNLGEARTYHLGFILGPRLNAAGRLENAMHSLDLISTKDAVEAQRLAYELEELNHQRQIEQARITAEADAMAETYSESPVLVLADASWSHGVVGIVASKLAEKWQKPTMIFQILGKSAKGSGRSANGYNIIEGLQDSRELFTKLGGHHFAAGATLPTTNIDILRDALAAHYRSVEAELTPTKATKEAEVKVEQLEEIDWQLYEALQMMEPFGNGNPQPVFGADGLKIVDVIQMGKEKEHIKLRLASDAGVIYEAIGFNLAERYPNVRSGQNIDLVFFLDKNQFNGRSHLQFVILAIQ